MRGALAFLTPFGRTSRPTPLTLDWFPVIGAAIGLAVGGVWWAAAKEWTPLVAAGLTVAADIALTGFLHLDGLADSADGLLPPMDRSRRLEVLHDPAVGAFGAIALVAVLLLRFGSLAATTAVPLTLGALWCGSRTAMAALPKVLHYARPEGGLVSAFLAPTAQDPDGPVWTGRSVVSGLVGLALAVTLAVLGSGSRGLVVLGAEAVGVAAVALLAQRRIGGYTGDVLGAAGVIGETFGLLALAAR
jgi:adenosylcobinamide-GDP ribazoletransferase